MLTTTASKPGRLSPFPHFLGEPLVGREVEQIEMEPSGHGGGSRVKGRNLMLFGKVDRLLENPRRLAIAAGRGEAQSQVRVGKAQGKVVGEVSIHLSRFARKRYRFVKPSLPVKNHRIIGQRCDAETPALDKGLFVERGRRHSDHRRSDAPRPASRAFPQPNHRARPEPPGRAPLPRTWPHAEYRHPKRRLRPNRAATPRAARSGRAVIGPARFPDRA